MSVHPPAQDAGTDERQTLLEQLARRDQEVASLGAQLAMTANGLAYPVLTGTYALQLFWRTAAAGYCEQNSVRAEVVHGQRVATYYLELPPAAQGDLRLDPGAEPGVWSFAELALYAVSDEGVLIEPPLAQCGPANGFAGLEADNEVVLDQAAGADKAVVCQAICWGHDPQLTLHVPPGGENRTRVLMVRCAAVDPTMVLLQRHGQELLAKIEQLQQAIGQLRREHEALQRAHDELVPQAAELAGQRARADELQARIDAMRKSRRWRFTQPLAWLYHVVSGR